MSIKEELRELVDRLSDEDATAALAYIRWLLREGEAAGPSAELSRRMGPAMVPGSEFFSQQTMDLDTLAARQGVRPVTNFDDLLGDFWPEDETADDFIAAVRQWRREGGYA